MDAVRDDFVNATRMTDEADFDLVELHFAHGYLLTNFLSPLTNHRDDEYGGSLENRLRYPLEIFDAVRAAWPEDKPISVRVSATDWIDGGITVEETIELARLLKARGCDIIDVSSGYSTPEAMPEFTRLYQVPLSERIRFEAGIPTMAVGAIAKHGDVNAILASGKADLCAIASRHLYDPYFTLHAAAEQEHTDQYWPEPYSSAKPVPREKLPWLERDQARRRFRLK